MADQEPSRRETEELRELRLRVAELEKREVTFKKLQDELCLFKSIVEASSEAIAASDPDGRIIYVNKAHEALFGKIRDEAGSPNYRDYYPPESIEVLDKVVAPALAQGESWEGVLEVIDSEGRCFPLWERADAVRDEDGKMLFCFGLMHDVSGEKAVQEELEMQIAERTADLIQANESLNREIVERKRFEESLKESEDRYRQLSDVTFEGIAFHEGGRIAYANRQYYEMFGYSAEDLDGKQMMPLTVAPESLDTVMGYVKSGSTEPYEAVGLRKDGTKFPILVQVRTIEFHGRTVRAAAIRDITDQKAAEEALLLDSEIMKNLADGVCLVRVADGIIVRANPQFEKMFGYGPGELLGSHISTVNATTDRSPEEIAAEILSALREHGLWTGEVLNVRKDGTPFWCSVSLTTFDRSEHGPVCISINQDISDRKRYEDKIKGALKEKEILLREIHHRVKNNLAVVTSLLRLQSRDAKDDFHLQMFADAQDRIRSMALAHERLYQSDDLAQVNMREYVASLVDHLLLTKKGIGSTVGTKKEVESIHLELDRAVPVGFLINELVSNSLKHGYPDLGPGLITISLRTVGRNWMEVCVRDDGIGIPETVDIEKPKSFGLNLIKLFTEQLQGTIECDRDGGTEFRIGFSCGS